MNKTPDLNKSEPRSLHPLEMIPLFRRWPTSLVRDIIYTGIWNTAIAVVMAAANMFFRSSDAGFSTYWWSSFLISNLIGYLIHGSLNGMDILLRGWPSRSRGVPRALYFVALLSVCVVLGLSIGSAMLRGHNAFLYLRSAIGIAQVIPFSVFVAFFVFTVLA